MPHGIPPELRCMGDMACRNLGAKTGLQVARWVLLDHQCTWLEHPRSCGLSCCAQFVLSREGGPQLLLKRYSY